MTDAILKLFIDSVDVDVSYTLKDLQKIMSTSYKEINKPLKVRGNVDNEEGKVRKVRTVRERDDNGCVIKKRAPSVYNLFIKEQIGKIKIDNPEYDNKIIFKMAIDAWNKQKGTQEKGNVSTIDA